MAAGVLARIRLGARVLDLRDGRVFENDTETARLTATELELVRYLAERRGQPVPDEVLLREVWGYAATVRTRTHFSTVNRIRRKIEADARDARHLVRSRDGYLLTHPEPSSQRAELVVPSTPLIGRDRLLAELEAATDRVVALVGPGGVGKTRLALAQASSGYLEGGVVVVALGGRTGPTAVQDAIAQVLGQTANTESNTPSHLATMLNHRGPCLVLVDQCEAHTEQVRQVVEALSASAPESRFLLTSRVRPGVAGERVIGVDPLALPDAVALLAERADRVQPGWSQADPEQVEQLAARLEGLPLALEIAAGRARVMSAGAMSERLDGRLRLLSTNAGGRHGSMRAVLEDSWSLLPEAARIALTHLATAPGSLSLSLAESLAHTDDLWGLDALQLLVDHSLIHRSRDTPPRFRVGEMVRVWCHEAAPEPWLDEGRARLEDAILKARGDLSVFQIVDQLGHAQRHVALVAATGRSDNARARCAATLAWIARERGGVREAWSLLQPWTDATHLDPDVARDVLVAAGHLTQRREHIDAWVARIDGSWPVRAAVLLGATALMTEPVALDPAAGERLVAQALEEGAPDLSALALRARAVQSLSSGRVEAAIADLVRASAYAEHAGLRRLATLIQINLGICYALCGRSTEAVDTLGPVSRAAEANDHPRLTGMALLHEARAQYTCGDQSAAVAAAREASLWLARVDATTMLGLAHSTHADALLELGRPTEALAIYSRAEVVYGSLPSHWGAASARLFAARAQLASGVPGTDVRPFLERDRHHPSALIRAGVCALTALCDAVDGHLEAAAHGFAQYGDHDAAAAARLWWFLAGAAPAVTLSRLGRTEEARELLGKAEGWYRQMHLVPGLEACHFGARLLADLSAVPAGQSSFEALLARAAGQPR